MCSDRVRVKFSPAKFARSEQAEQQQQPASQSVLFGGIERRRLTIHHAYVIHIYTNHQFFFRRFFFKTIHLFGSCALVVAEIQMEICAAPAEIRLAGT